MRVLHVIADTDRRRANLFAHQLSGALAELGQESSTAALRLGAERPGLGDEVLSTDGGRAAVRTLKARMREVDATVAHGPDAGEACARAASRRTGFVYRQVRDTRGWLDRPAHPSSTPSYLDGSAAVVALSSGARAELVEAGARPSATYVVPIGIPLDDLGPIERDDRVAARERAGVGDDELLVMSMGALVSGKGIDVAIRAMVDLDGAHLVVVGDGPEADRLSRLADGIAAGRVTFAHAVEKAQRAYAAADVVVHPSVSGDSMPVVPIEAGLCGLPTVVTSIGSTEEIVEHGRTGLVVPPGDVDALRTGLEALRLDSTQRQAMGDEARARCVSRFDLDIVAGEWVTVLERVTT